MTGRLMALLVPLAMIGALVAAPSALASEKSGLLIAQAHPSTATGAHKTTVKKHKKTTTKAVKGGGGGMAKKTTAKHKKTTKAHAKPSGTMGR